MGGPSHQESSLRQSGNSRDTEKPEKSDSKLRHTTSKSGVHTGQLNQGSGSAIDNVTHRSRLDICSRDSDVGYPSSPSSNFSSSGNPGNPSFRTFTSTRRQRNVSDATSSGSDNERKRYGQYNPGDGDPDAFTFKNRTKITEGILGSNDTGQQSEESKNESREVDFDIVGTRNSESRNVVTVRGVQFEMFSPRPNRKTGYPNGESAPEHASSTNENARSPTK